MSFNSPLLSILVYYFLIGVTGRKNYVFWFVITRQTGLLAWSVMLLRVEATNRKMNETQWKKKRKRSWLWPDRRPASSCQWDWIQINLRLKLKGKMTAWNGLKVVIYIITHNGYTSSCILQCTEQYCLTCHGSLQAAHPEVFWTGWHTSAQEI